MIAQRAIAWAMMGAGFGLIFATLAGRLDPDPPAGENPQSSTPPAAHSADGA